MEMDTDMKLDDNSDFDIPVEYETITKNQYISKILDTDIDIHIDDNDDDIIYMDNHVEFYNNKKEEIVDFDDVILENSYIDNNSNNNNNNNNIITYDIIDYTSLQNNITKIRTMLRNLYRESCNTYDIVNQIYYKYVISFQNRYADSDPNYKLNQILIITRDRIESLMQHYLYSMKYSQIRKMFMEIYNIYKNTIYSVGRTKYHYNIKISFIRCLYSYSNEYYTDDGLDVLGLKIPYIPSELDKKIMDYVKTIRKPRSGTQINITNIRRLFDVYSIKNIFDNNYNDYIYPEDIDYLNYTSSIINSLYKKYKTD